MNHAARRRLALQGWIAGVCHETRTETELICLKRARKANENSPHALGPFPLPADERKMANAVIDRQSFQRSISITSRKDRLSETLSATRRHKHEFKCCLGFVTLLRVDVGQSYVGDVTAALLQLVFCCGGGATDARCGHAFGHLGRCPPTLVSRRKTCQPMVVAKKGRLTGIPKEPTR